MGFDYLGGYLSYPIETLDRTGPGGNLALLLHSYYMLQNYKYGCIWSTGQESRISFMSQVRLAIEVYYTKIFQISDSMPNLDFLDFFIHSRSVCTEKHFQSCLIVFLKGISILNRLLFRLYFLP